MRSNTQKTLAVWHTICAKIKILNFFRGKHGGKWCLLDKVMVACSVDEIIKKSHVWFRSRGPLGYNVAQWEMKYW